MANPSILHHLPDWLQFLWRERCRNLSTDLVRAYIIPMVIGEYEIIGCVDDEFLVKHRGNFFVGTRDFSTNVCRVVAGRYGHQLLHEDGTVFYLDRYGWQSTPYIVKPLPNERCFSFSGNKLCLYNFRLELPVTLEPSDEVGGWTPGVLTDSDTVLEYIDEIFGPTFIVWRGPSLWIWRQNTDKLEHSMRFHEVPVDVTYNHARCRVIVLYRWGERESFYHKAV